LDWQLLDLEKLWDRTGIAVVGSSPEEFAARMRVDIARTAKLTKDAHIPVQ